jgi:hypothetical protein
MAIDRHIITRSSPLSRLRERGLGRGAFDFPRADTQSENRGR